MGIQKRKARNLASLKRREPKRDEYDKILIVCEGEKTEPSYFCGARDYYRLNTANVAVCGECGSDPMSVVNFAKQRYKQAKNSGDPFNKVYCVFDKDMHPNYLQALSTLKKAVPAKTFEAINSVPSFEYWLLLHFVYTTRPYNALPGNSAGDQVLTDLVREMPAYRKGLQNVFKSLFNRLDIATEHATRASVAVTAEGTDNPSTRVHELVVKMRDLKKTKEDKQNTVDQ